MRKGKDHGPDPPEFLGAYAMSLARMPYAKTGEIEGFDAEQRPNVQVKRSPGVNVGKVNWGYCKRLIALFGPGPNVRELEV